LREATNFASRRNLEGFSCIQVDEFPVITYPWEWSFPLFKKMAVETLWLRKTLLDEGFDLQDASPLNIQFSSPTQTCLIDLGSVVDFRIHRLGWAAIRQFADEMLNVLLLSEALQLDTSQIVQAFGFHGVNAALTRDKLSLRRRYSPSLYFFHGATNPRTGSTTATSRPSHLTLSESLRLTKSQSSRIEKLVASIEIPNGLKTEWKDYSTRSHYEDHDLDRKVDLARKFANHLNINGARILDLGGNDGLVSDALVGSGFQALNLDPDHGAVARSTTAALSDMNSSRALSLIGDFRTVNQSKGMFGNEFPSLAQRFRPDAVMLLSVIHHLVITQGVSLDMVADGLRQIAPNALVEFPTIEDEKVRQLISRVDNWTGDYSIDQCRESLGRVFKRVAVLGNTSPTRVMIACHGQADSSVR
jgi:2-polyprenyl-3-methyl-5-hydroxy-6-metoxy-1,4-benzoquinol methylase